MPYKESKAGLTFRDLCAARSSDPGRRVEQNESANHYQDGISSSEVRLRVGGGDQRHAGKLGWLKTARTLEKTPDRSEREHSPSRVTYKGKEIGFPQLAPALHVLPPASRFVREPEHRATAATARSQSADSSHVLVEESPNALDPDHDAAHLTTSLLSPPSVLLATTSRPTTSNPWAGVYGNPYVVRACADSLPVVYAVASSLADRLSALGGSQKGYDPRPESPRTSPLRVPGETSFIDSASCKSTACPDTQQVRRDRKWDALPPLPPSEEAFESSSNEDDSVESGADHDENFDTEEILNSLRPERLGLYHISVPGRSVNSSADAWNTSADIAEQPTQSNALGTSVQVNEDPVEASDHYSFRTEDWVLHSNDTDDLGLDDRLKEQPQIARRAATLQEQQRQTNISNNIEALHDLPEADAPTPESLFCADMIETVYGYQEQLQRVIRRLCEAGEMSQEHYIRERGRYKTAMERKLRAAEDMTGYKMLTNEADIREAIKQTTGYAIYSLLLKVRDPETWQRIFEPALLPARQDSATSTPHRQTTVPPNSLVRILRKTGRGLRFMLAVPDNHDLETYSSTHPHACAPHTVTYVSKVGVLGPNITSRPLHTNRPKFPPPASASTPTIHFSQSMNFAIHDQLGPSTRTERRARLFNDTPRIHNYDSTFDVLALTPPFNHRVAKVPRSRGYEDGAFVTVLDPFSGEDGGGRDTFCVQCWEDEIRDDRTEVTLWPEVEF